MDELKDWIVIVSLIIFVLLIAIFFCAITNKISCEAAWKDSGRRYDWSFFGDCRVADKNNNLIPAKNIRDVN